MTLKLSPVTIPAVPEQIILPEVYSGSVSFIETKEGLVLEIIRKTRARNDKGDLFDDYVAPSDYILRLPIEMLGQLLPQYATFASDLEKVTDLLDPKLEHLPSF